MVDEPNQGAAGDAPEASGETPLSVATAGDAYQERPELFVGAAFLGGFVVAQILKRVGE